MRIAIFSGGNMHVSKYLIEAAKLAEYTIAVDSGAKHALKLDIIPDIVVGDFDSIDKKTMLFLKNKKIPLLPYPPEKNETDTQLAVQYALKKRATKIIILGGISGNRFDHILANFLLSFVTPVPLIFLDGNQQIWLENEAKTVQITGKKGDVLSLIPLQQNVEGITTKGLKYPLSNETLFFGQPRGVSNVFLNDTVKVKFTKGNFLIIQTKK